MNREQQNTSITRQTEEARRAAQAEDRRTERRLRQSAAETASYEQQAGAIRPALAAIRHLLNRTSWAETVRITGLTEVQLRSLKGVTGESA